MVNLAFKSQKVKKPEICYDPKLGSGKYIFISSSTKYFIRTPQKKSDGIALQNCKFHY